MEYFYGTVKGHKIEIVTDSGIFRHIKFRNPGTTDMSFELTTWPNHLCISGDMGTYVFSRLEDMFVFFRGHDINPDYWHEKLVADSRFEPAKKFSHELFVRIIKEEFARACIDREIPVRSRKEIWKEIKYDVLSAETEQDAHDSVLDFESCGFRFDDFWEHDLKEYTFHFIWCLLAIVWGISEYDHWEE